MSYNNLAIVIPAYKSAFFKETLNSIASQTCKQFKLYIGDDASNDDLESIAKSFKNQISFSYKRFENNLGKENLVKHWNRCIDLTNGEEWIWLFSDDDIMGPTCVEDFYYALEHYVGYSLYRFNFEKIDDSGEILHVGKPFAEVMTVKQLLIGRLESTIQTTVVEYIFRKSKLVEEGYFQYFDLGWGSDDATWIKIGRKEGIRRISDATVYWRQSTQNISNSKSNEMMYRKVNARIQFTSWILEQIDNNDLSIDKIFLKGKLSKWFDKYLKLGLGVLKFKEIHYLLELFYKVTFSNKLVIHKVAYFYFLKSKIIVKKNLPYFTN